MSNKHSRTDRSSVLDPDDAAYPGQHHYSPSFLRIYDPLVLGFFARFVWRCSTGRLVEQYNRHIGARHLDVGPGTGYFLEKAPPTEGLTLLDPNLEVLAHASRRLSSRSPIVLAADILQPIATDDRFDSAALNYVIHCLPGPMERKAAAVRNVAAVLEPDGVLFGATLLGERHLYNPFSRAAFEINNRRGIFDNLGDTEAGLRAMLEASFDQVDIEIAGSVAIFSATAPRGSPEIIHE